MMVVMMVVMVVIMTSPRRHDHDAPAVVMVMMVMMVMGRTDIDLRQLDFRLSASRALLLVYRLQHGGGIRDGLQELRIGVGLQHIAWGRRRRSLSR